MDSDDKKISTSRFYFEWKGHQIPDITAFHSTTRSLRPNKSIIYLAGDSSLDNKHWVPSSGPFGEPLSAPVPEIYLHTLDTKNVKPDIAFWLNHLLSDRATTLNLAVEASTLRERDDDLLEHDKFIRDNIRADDILIVSVGGNDIALKPTGATIFNMLQLAWLTPRWFLSRGNAWCLRHFTHIFKPQTEDYISRLISKQKPRAVIVCMIYYPLEASASKQSSWADVPLKALGYNWFPGQLQTGIRQMYEQATKKIRVEGVEVVPCALFEVLDGKDGRDYTARVEPSAEGGRKVAVLLKEILDEFIPASQQKS